MKRYKKKDILQAIETLAEANNVILKAVKVNPQGAADALAACQELAIQTGECLEARGKESAPAVAILEEYCEDIYRMSENIFGAGQLKKISGLIVKKLTKLKHSVSYDLPGDKKEVVFLPYKASMWDSLESVWKAADEDKGTDAYVIPIPYYDKNPNGSFREMHYEGDLYPDYVPITHYSAYDMEERRPDAIYIHNPYDEGNYVTSVEPYFYSKNLKKFTNKLVYIPYFILREIDPENQAAIDSVKHFCFVPGTIYADQVIVQSENIRKIYINEYIKAAKETGLGGVHVDRGFLEKKFLGTGSPKIDKVLHTKKEDLEIPPAWLRIIEKSDGSWKRVVFYNTSVSALLQYGEKMLRKMESVFEIFMKNKDEITLLWRPHPLIQATIESMRPQLWEKYKEIRDRYLEEEWGIYDDTADLDRAVVISDAYYGDMSSVMQLCQKAGLLVMLQNVNISKRSRDQFHVYGSGGDIGEDVVWGGDKIWFCPQYFNSLFCMDILTGEVKFLGEFPDEKYGAERLYASMKMVKGKIYFIPFSAKTIAIYDIKTGEFSNIPIDEKRAGGKAETNFLFMGVENYENYLFIFPVFCKAIIRLNVDNQEIDYITDWFEEVKENIFNKACGFFRKQIVVQEGKLYVPFCNVNAVLALDCNTLKSKVYKLGEEKTGYSGICCDGDDFYLSPIETGDLCKWNIKKNCISKIKIYKEYPMKNLYAYIGVLNVDHKILLFPSNHEDGVLNESIKNIEIKKGRFSFAREEMGSSAYYDMDEGLLTIIQQQDNRSITVQIPSDKVKADIKKLLKTCRDYIFEIPGATITNMIGILNEGYRTKDIDEIM